MKSTLIVVLGLFFLFSGVQAQSLNQQDEDAIRMVLKEQNESWNKGDIQAFMKGYWKSDSLIFIGKKGITHGWQKTLDNYLESYPDKKKMGQLKFDILSVESLGGKRALVIGKWLLIREIGDLGGHFSLIWKKMNGEWVIVADHSS